MNNWKLERREHEIKFTEIIHKIELKIVEGETIIKTWSQAMELHQSSIDQILNAFSGLPQFTDELSGISKIDITSAIIPIMGSYQRYINKLTEHKQVLVDGLTTLLTVGDRLVEGDATEEEFMMAYQEIMFLGKKFQADTTWKYEGNENE